MNRLTTEYMGCKQIIECGNETCEETCARVKQCELCPIQKAIVRLSEYEEKEENGLLIQFPFEVGKTLFALIDTLDHFGCHCVKIKKVYIKRYEYNHLKNLTIVCGDPHIDKHIRVDEYRFFIGDIEKRIFETEEKALLEAFRKVGVENKK